MSSCSSKPTTSLSYRSPSRLLCGFFEHLFSIVVPSYWDSLWITSLIWAIYIWFWQLPHMPSRVSVPACSWSCLPLLFICSCSCFCSSSSAPHLFLLLLSCIKFSASPPAFAQGLHFQPVQWNPAVMMVQVLSASREPNLSYWFFRGQLSR